MNPSANRQREDFRKHFQYFVRAHIQTRYKMNRFHLAVRVYSDNAQRTSKRGENISHATRLRLVAYFSVLTAF